MVATDNVGNVCWVVATDSGGNVCWVVETDSGGNVCWVVYIIIGERERTNLVVRSSGIFCLYIISERR